MTDTLAKQPTAAPTPKWIASTTSAAGVIALLWVASLLGLELTEVEAGALVLLGGAVAGYFKKNRAPRGSTPGSNGVPDHGA